MIDPEKNINISINAGTIVKAILIIFLFVALFVLKDVVLVVLTAIIIASAIEPAIKWFAKRQVNRVFAAIFVYAGFAAFLAAVFYFFVPSLLRETSSFLSLVPKYVDSVSLWDPFSSNVVGTKEIAQDLSMGIQESRQVVEDFSNGVSLREIVNNINVALSNISSGIFQTLSAVFGGILSFVLIVVLSFYFAVQEEGIEKFLSIITPARHEPYVIGLWKRSQLKIGRWLQGQLLLGILVGVLVYLGLMVLGVKNALLFAFLAALFEIIPLFGPILAAIPAIGVSYVDGGVTAALLVTGLYVIIQQFENHLIYPLVVKKIVGVPPILVILALIVGGKLAGFLGILLSVPLAAMLMEFFEDIDKAKHTSQKSA